MLKTRIKIAQSKKAWTQYITIPAAMVQDSQYPFKDGDELFLEIEPATGTMILSKTERKVNLTPKGIQIDVEPDIGSEQTTLIKTTD